MFIFMLNSSSATTAGKAGTNVEAPSFKPKTSFKYVLMFRVIQGIIVDVLIFYDMNMTSKNGNMELFKCID